MDIQPIRTEADYDAALKAVSALVDADPAPGTLDGDRLEILAILVEKYEAEHFPMSAPTPIEAIRFRMEQAGLTVPDMQPYIGNSNRVYEVLSGRRALSLNMIRKLHDGLHIPADVLIGRA
ncbi:transcriptional regulator [Burkholderia pseudomultivorans]|uniref:helix-turn-helix domain-containing protein n=1 Tax=Burkholderia pseudomultivorans TaxID=1207504 RepID=UPI0001FDA76A|nr:transcriptional regulator [Burkholderia pseudomultivorans]EGD05941.1 putative transcriptional regulator [Burkholderia sp. TJI49]AOI92379.1 transcriptional regulator [Burkholderia pseudomultivorans]KVC22059.1 transcriptional regulator [Burkholderia pseudomultivorans]KVC29538.1 transcriptional regulator [Burkholderia pseudomultivorans]KVC51077.1 transcriptional regulator [Burkholderia pseudomultivorans]